MQPGPRKNTLRKKERLFERKAIETVFNKGRSIVEHPIRMLWIIKPKENGELLKAGFAVPAKIFKRAVDRNLLKRRMREAYRKNKHIIGNLVEEKQVECHIMFIYTDKQIADYRGVESKIVVTLNRLLEYANSK